MHDFVSIQIHTWPIYSGLIFFLGRGHRNDKFEINIISAKINSLDVMIFYTLTAFKNVCFVCIIIILRTKFQLNYCFF